MPTKNYYIILGVSQNESATGIQDAFRELAKKYHPDVVGPEGTQRFQEILEAYRNLSDPRLRAQYDYSLEPLERRERGRAEPIILGRGQRPEPLKSEPVSVLRSFQTIHPSFDEIFDRLLRNFTGIGIPKGERIQDLNLEVTLSPREAAEGRILPVRVPVFHRCPQCGGSGRDWLFPCTYCREHGMIEEEETIHIRIPARVPDGTILETPIGGLGIHNFYLRLQIRIAA